MMSLRQTDRTPLQKSLAWLFALVIVGFGLVQAVHVHNDLAKQSAPASHCSLCLAAHHAAAVVPDHDAPAPALRASAVTLTESHLESQLRVGASFIRPPPQTL
jgi:hypothetical protein